MMTWTIANALLEVFNVFDKAIDLKLSSSCLAVDGENQMVTLGPK